jgi:hypothetical protein
MLIEPAMRRNSFSSKWAPSRGLWSLVPASQYSLACCEACMWRAAVSANDIR